MKILLVITGLGMGGAENVVCAMADSLSNRGHIVKLVYLSGSVSVSPKSPTVELIPIGMNSAKDLFVSLIKLCNIIKDFKPDVVNSHLVHANLITRLLRVFTPIPRLVSSAHNTNEEGKVRELLYRFTDRLTDMTTNVSQEAVDAFVDNKMVNKSKIACIYNGIDTHKFSYDSEAKLGVLKELNLIKGQPILLAVGRLDEPKDYPNLLNALSILKDTNAVLLIAGDGPLKQSLYDLTVTLGIAARVKFLGVRHDISRLMSASDAFVLSSAWEGFGLVVAEAMACNCITVATDSGGVKEVVGDSGFLVPVKNSQLLANCIDEALGLPLEQADLLRKSARDRIINNYSVERMVDDYLTFYN